VTETAALVEAAGYTPRDALVVGVQRADRPPEFFASGRTPAGDPVGAETGVYTASLAKQVTATCAALLVQQGRLQPESSLATWMPELPGWARKVQVRHLVSHISGLPSTHDDDRERAGLDRTTAGVIDALARRDRLDHAPGTRHRYSNAGYVCLGLVVARAAGRPLADVARELVLDPLGLANSRFWAGPAPHPPGAAPLDPPHPAPLSQGDGGFWSTAADLLRWNLAMDRDALGASALVQTPGRLDDGTPLDYAWGVGVRKHAGRLIYRHGGRWPGLSAQLVRLADAGSSFVILALDDEEDRTVLLAQRMIDSLVG
jgi:CubicO group peptidase (beta-lactamase class C family)